MRRKLEQVILYTDHVHECTIHFIVSAIHCSYYNSTGCSESMRVIIQY